MKNTVKSKRSTRPGWVSGTEYAALRDRSVGWVSKQVAAGMPHEGGGREGRALQIPIVAAMEWERRKKEPAHWWDEGSPDVYERLLVLNFLIQLVGSDDLRLALDLIFEDQRLSAAQSQKLRRMIVAVFATMHRLAFNYPNEQHDWIKAKRAGTSAVLKHIAERQL